MRGARSSPHRQACWIAPVIRPVTSSGLDWRDRLVGDLAAAAHHHDAVADREDVRHAVADQDDRDALVAQAADQVEHLGDLAHRDRRGRLVHQHDLGLRQARARDRDRLALAARHPAHEVARPRLRFELAEQLAGALVHGARVEELERAEAAADLAAEEDIGRGGQVVAEREVLIDDLDAVLARPRPACGNGPAGRCSRISPLVGGKLPAMILTSVDLPAPLSPIRPSTSPGSRSRSTSVNALMAPKFFEILRRERTGTQAFPNSGLRLVGAPPAARATLECRFGIV